MKSVNFSKIASQVEINDFDFSHVRVRYQGRSLSRYDIAYYLDCFRPFLNWKIIYDSFSYAALRDTLINYIYAATI